MPKRLLPRSFLFVRADARKLYDSASGVADANETQETNVTILVVAVAVVVPQRKAVLNV